MDRGDDLWELVRRTAGPVAAGNGQVVLRFVSRPVGWSDDADALENLVTVARPAYDEDPLRGAVEAIVFARGRSPMGGS